MGSLGAPEIIILVVVIALVFGWKKLPDAARSLGRSMRILKSEVGEMKNDSKTADPQKNSDSAHSTKELPSAAQPTVDPYATYNEAIDSSKKSQNH